MELLVSKKVEIASGVPSLTTRMKLYITLLIGSLIVLVSSVFGLLLAKDSSLSNQEMVVSSAYLNMGDILSVLAFPVMLLLVLFVVYISQKIYVEYRAVYNPKAYGRSRKRNVE